MEPSTTRIPARNKREAMDWGLVLASQEIEATITHDEEGWGLLVESRDDERARAAVQQYVFENRGWKWRQRLPGSTLLFHWGSLIWATALILFHYWSSTRFPFLQPAGIMDSEAVRSGQWWRLFTAVTLHADISHLMANVSTGVLLFGFAMARYGGGVAVLAAFLAGVVGNAAGFFFYSEHHRSLGASGMVTGALGLLAVESISFWRKNPPAAKILFRAMAAAVLILVLIGFSPNSDVVAHVGGFVAGAIFGCALGFFRRSVLQDTVVNLVCGLLLAGLIITTWWQAAH